MYEPDEQTKERLKNLSAVGKALNDTFSEENLDTGDDFYLAIEYLDKFQKGLDELILEETVRKGMNDLVVYLKKKIQKRMKIVGNDVEHFM